ncbi:MAG: hypothetical protein K1X74_14865 [Pirellulales bacterium]|nr:hypothetical protein [Pirellulales bacterium]
MLSRVNPGWKTLVVTHVVSLCMLGFYQSAAAQKPTPEPFANAVEQRFEMITQLKEINAQLREQNALLRSGKLQVVVAPKR